jgi:hypothetical protein
MNLALNAPFSPGEAAPNATCNMERQCPPTYIPAAIFCRWVAGTHTCLLVARCIHNSNNDYSLSSNGFCPTVVVVCFMLGSHNYGGECLAAVCLAAAQLVCTWYGTSTAVSCCPAFAQDCSKDDLCPRPNVVLNAPFLLKLLQSHLEQRKTVPSNLPSCRPFFRWQCWTRGS